MNTCVQCNYLSNLSRRGGSFIEIKTQATSKLVGVVWRIQRFTHAETTVCAFETARRFKELAQPVVLFSEWRRLQVPFTWVGLEVVFPTSENQAFLSSDLRTAVPDRAACAQPPCCVNNIRGFARAFHVVLSQLQFVSSF